LRISRASALLATAALVALAGIPALAGQGQNQDRGQQKPESILPPGFNDPDTTAVPTPAPSAASRPVAPVAGVGTGPVITAVPAAPGALPSPLATPTPTPVPTMDAATLAKYEMPAYARRSLGLIGPAHPDDGALGPHAFGNTDGRFLEGLMRRLDAPIASRWIEIGLRRALVSQVYTPPRVNGADFAAERAWLLLRMGESIAARDVAQSVDTIDATPKLYQMIMQTSLATGDPAGLCAFAEKGFAQTGERGWVLARAMCAGLAGLPGKATPILNSARNNNVAGGVNLLLAQKVMGSGAGGRQQVTIEWESVDTLSAWRYGLALATGTEIPDTLLATLGPQVRSWRAQAPQLTPAQRAHTAEYAAVRGVLSNAALVDLYGAVTENDDDQALAESGIARDLRTAYDAGDLQARLDMFKQLWDEPKTPDGRYGRLILTARAAARIPVGTKGADVDRLVASMLTAGLDLPALRWRDTAATGSDAWAMLMLADPARAGHIYSDIGRYGGSDPEGLKRKMLFVGLAGLGRMPAPEIEKGARALDIKIGNQNGWTRALAKAALSRQPGTVLLLAGIGMQTRLWQGVSPEAIFHIVAALRASGQDGLARMVAVEAVARA
jgi:hypothetical protein